MSGCRICSPKDKSKWNPKGPCHQCQLRKAGSPGGGGTARCPVCEGTCGATHPVTGRWSACATCEETGLVPCNQVKEIEERLEAWRKNH